MLIPSQLCSLISYWVTREAKRRIWLTPSVLNFSACATCGAGDGKKPGPTSAANSKEPDLCALGRFPPPQAASTQAAGPSPTPAGLVSLSLLGSLLPE